MTDLKPFKCIFIVILLLIIGIIGCKTIGFASKAEWIAPDKPKEYPVKFSQKDNGLYIDAQSSANLRYNIEELDIYIKKLEALLSEIESYYGFKVVKETKGDK